MKRKFSFSKTDIIMLIMFVLLVFIDRITKILSINYLKESKKVLIDGVLELTYLENTGSAFGFMNGKGWIIGIISIVVICYIIYLYFRLSPDQKLLKFLLMTLCAGAISNFVDRILHGYVVDFISFVLINFPVFNFADIIICLSVFFIFIFMLRSKEDQLNKLFN